MRSSAPGLPWRRGLRQIGRGDFSALFHLDARHKRARLVVWALACLAFVAGCDGADAPGERAVLLVAAASDLDRSLPLLAAGFREREGIVSEAVYGASGMLVEQIRQGAPYDLFLSANRDYIQKLANEDIIIKDSVAPYARGVLVLASAKGRGEAPTMEELVGDSIRHIAIANPAHAPYGLAARQALEHAGLWERLKPKLVYAESVRQALRFVESGNADAGFVGQAAAEEGRVDFRLVDAGLYDPIEQYLGVVAASPRREGAQRFAELIRSAWGQGVLKRGGFLSVPAVDAVSDGRKSD